MIPVPKPVPPTVAEARSGDLVRPLWVAIAFLLPVLAYFSTSRSIVAIWERSETFAHGYTILPISLWLVWRRRAELAQIPIQPYWPGFVLLALCGAGWLMAGFGDVQVAQQYALGAMLPLTVLAVLGRRMALALAFPLAYVLLAVPFGETFVDPLIDVTANFTVDALRMTGIPVWREGNSFTIPSGNWSVIEGCSGVRYLIASFTLGCLYAYLTYHSLRRRLIFIALAIVVPIIANGMRAYLIVMIGHLSGMTMAVGFDHLIYGWLFFGLVMFVLFWLGSWWREDKQDAIPSGPPAPPTPPSRLALALLAAILCIGFWPAYAAYLDKQSGQGAARELTAWTPAWPATEAFTDWQPAFTPARSESRRFYASQGRVGLALRYYSQQDQVSKLISSTNRLTSGARDSAWDTVSSSVRTEMVGGQPLPLRESHLVNKVNGQCLLVWQWYWIGGHATPSEYLGKLYQAGQKITRGSDAGTAVFVFVVDEEQNEGARRSLHAFLDSNRSALEAMLASDRQP